MSGQLSRRFTRFPFHVCAALLSAALMLASTSASAQVQTLTGGTAANSSLQQLATTGGTYMGPGTGYLTDPGNDTTGANGVAVPVLSGTHLANLAVHLAGAAGNDGSSGYNFAVCVTHGGVTSCPSTGVACSIIGSTSYCSDIAHSVAITAGDLVMIRAIAVGDASDKIAAKWSLQITP